MIRTEHDPWKKRKWKRLLLCLTAVVLAGLLVFAVPQAAKAFGDFDSRSDYGGSSRSDSSDSDSDGIDLYFILRLAGWLSDLLGVDPILMFFILLAVFVALYVFRYRKHKDAAKSPSDNWQAAIHYRPDTINTLHSEDPGFDENQLIRRVTALYEQMQLCWEQGDISPMRKDFMPDTWTRFHTQLQNKKAAGEVTHVRNIRMEGVFPLSYAKDQEHQVLTLEVDVTQNVWTTDREGKSVQGTEKTRKFFKFLWTLKRPLDSVTGTASGLDGTHCPNCGAEIDLEAFAECPFCHTPVMKVSADWVISEIDAVFQRTDHK